MKQKTQQDKRLFGLWQFPEEDFDAWWALVLDDGGDAPECKTYVEYKTLMAAIQADIERRGDAVFRVKMTVREMQTELRGTFETGLKNTGPNRAKVVARRLPGAVQQSGGTR